MRTGKQIRGETGGHVNDNLLHLAWSQTPSGRSIWEIHRRRGCAESCSEKIRSWRVTPMIPLPPETTTTLEPQLRWIYNPQLGWPGTPAARPKSDLKLSERLATVKP